MEGKVIYPTSDEKLVNAVVLFAGTEGGLFYDEALLKPVSTDEALNLFKKGLILVSVDGGFKRPTGITVTEGGYTVIYGEGGGSKEDFVVHLGRITEHTFTSDKDAEEIVNAVNAGKNVYAEYIEDGIPMKMFLIVGVKDEEEDTYYVLFTGVLVHESVVPVGFFMIKSGDGTRIEFITSEMLPKIDEDDNGKVLTAVDGEWKAQALTTE